MIPASVTSIAEDAFDGCPQLVIRCSASSVAYAFAQAHGIAVELLEEAPDITYGDLDGDGSVGAADALNILQFAAKLAIPTDTQKLCADVDGNGSVDAKDALYVLQKAAKFIDVFPVEE